MRLTGKRGPTSQVEVKVGGTWGGVCDDGFNKAEGDVVCRQLGFLAAQQVVKRAGAGQAVLAGLNCEGTEANLADCRLGGAPRCGPAQLAGVVCIEKVAQCGDKEFHCRSGECIGIDKLCDGIENDCQDGSDEDKNKCDSRVQVRLTGAEGLLEVRHQGVWGTVCYDYFGQAEADVFCRMLGRGRAVDWDTVDTITTRAGGSWPIWIHFEQENSCNGSEAHIAECHARKLWSNSVYCQHREDVVLSCKVRNNGNDWFSIGLTSTNPALCSYN